jgi:hypothetical protein
MKLPAARVLVAHRTLATYDTPPASPETWHE